mgnify:CR=1 FL=1
MNLNRGMNSGNEQGFTLIEIIVVTVIMAILAGMAVTTLSSEGSKLRAAAYNLRTELLSAKAEAIKRNQTATIDFDNANDSYQATVGGDVIFQNSLQNGIDLTSSHAQFHLTAVSTCFPNSGTVTLSHMGQKYEVKINATGKVTVTHTQ